MIPSWREIRLLLGAIGFLGSVVLAGFAFADLRLAILWYQAEIGYLAIGYLMNLIIHTGFLFLTLGVVYCLTEYRWFVLILRTAVGTAAVLIMLALVIRQDELSSTVSRELDQLLLACRTLSQAQESVSDAGLDLALRELEIACRTRKRCSRLTWAHIVNIRERRFEIPQTRSVLFRLALEHASFGLSSDFEEWLAVAIESGDSDIVGTGLWYIRETGGPRPVKISVREVRGTHGELYLFPDETEIAKVIKGALGDPRTEIRSRAQSVLALLSKRNEHSSILSALNTLGAASDR